MGFFSALSVSEDLGENFRRHASEGLEFVSYLTTQNLGNTEKLVLQVAFIVQRERVIPLNLAWMI